MFKFVFKYNEKSREGFRKLFSNSLLLKNGKIISILICLVMVTGLLVTVQAASYPRIYPDDYERRIAKGNSAVLKFEIFNEFKNERVNINVYKGDKVDKNNLIESETFDIYTGDGIYDYTYFWRGSNKDSGIYTIEYYVSFYSYYEWHDAPDKETMPVTVFEPNEVINSVLSTDVKAYIDGYPIESYNINGNTAIVVEDLMNYGFEVVYNETERSLKIKDSKGAIISSYQHNNNGGTIGKKLMNVYDTDIRTYMVALSEYTNNYIDFGVYKTYNVNGKTLMKIDELDHYGTITWDSVTRTISFKRN